MTEPITDKTPKISDGRIQVRSRTVADALSDVESMLYQRLGEKGFGAWLSRHEILGVVAEEHAELIDAVQKKEIEHVKGELIDIAVACLFGIACINQEAVDW